MGIAIRKYEEAWNRTMGCNLARSADVLAASLPTFDNIVVAVRRRIKGKGDIDLAVYDIISCQMLVCEIKTVYDKHRTVRQMQRFEESKVNLAHAIGQLHLAISAVRSGAMSMRTIFGRHLPSPERVRGALLTWVDPIDLIVGTVDENLLSLNFATFSYLLRRSEGDLPAMLRAISELRNIWCGAERRAMTFK